MKSQSSPELHAYTHQGNSGESHAAQAFDILVEGNERFVSNLRLNRNLLQQVNETSDGQYPFAIVLSCIDSRTSAELVFDQGLGDIFSVRIAGNVLNEDILGSMEFACEVAGLEADRGARATPGAGRSRAPAATWNSAT